MAAVLRRSPLRGRARAPRAPGDPGSRTGSRRRATSVGVLVQRPGREHDDVARPPREAHAVDDRLARPLHHVVHGAAGVAMRLQARAAAAASGPSRPSSGGARARSAGACTPARCRPTRRRRARASRRATDASSPRSRAAAATTAGAPSPTWGSGSRGRGATTEALFGLVSGNWCWSYIWKNIALSAWIERDVEPVHPDHGLVGLVAVVVPRPARRQDEIAGRHVDALAVDRRCSRRRLP